MGERLQKGQRVRQKTRGSNGTILSVDHDPGLILASSVTYTVEWDDPGMGMKREPMISPAEIEPIAS